MQTIEPPPLIKMHVTHRYRLLPPISKNWWTPKIETSEPAQAPPPGGAWGGLAGGGGGLCPGLHAAPLLPPRHRRLHSLQNGQTFLELFLQVELKPESACGSVSEAVRAAREAAQVVAFDSATAVRRRASSPDRHTRRSEDSQPKPGRERRCRCGAADPTELKTSPSVGSLRHHSLVVGPWPLISGGLSFPIGKL